MGVELKEKEWKYDAFISYRHLEPDAFVAGSIHKLLENYKIPSRLAKDNDKKLKRTRINKVFRDAEELPLTSNLNDSIMDALTNSEYLIVICSPRLSESLWCRKEIETFIELRGLDHVLTVLAEGEPSVSFPEALLYKEVDVLQADGTVKKVKEPLEPLAADARGNSNKERIKKLKTESLRLMAPMFGCSFDDLRQRQRERKLKRVISLATTIAAVGIAFGVISTSMALKISSQNSQISKQNEQIVAQAQEIERQYQEVLVSNGEAVADYSRKLFEEGDRIEALNRAYEVFPHEGVEVPRLDSVQYLMSDALHLYENGYYIKADRKLTCDSGITNMFLSPEATRLVTVDGDDRLVFWNTETGERLGSYTGTAIDNERQIVAYKNENEIWFTDDSKLYAYDIDHQKSTIIAESGIEVSYSEDEDRLLAVDNNGFSLYKASDNSLIKNVKYADEFGDSFTFCYGSSKLGKFKDKYFASVLSSFSETDMIVAVFDTESGNLVDTMHITNGTVGGIKIMGDELILSINFILGDGNYMDLEQFRTDVYDIDITADGCSLRWSRRFEGMSSRDMTATNVGAGKYVASQFYDKIVLMNHEDGSIFRTESFGSPILRTYCYSGSEQLSVITKDGSWNIVSDSLEEPYVAPFFDCRDSYITSFESSNGCTVCSPINGDTATIYRYMISPMAEAVDEYAAEEEKEPENKDEILDELAQCGVSKAYVSRVFYSDNMAILGVQYRNGKLELFGVNADGSVNSTIHTTLDKIEEDITGIKVKSDGSYIVLSGTGYAYILNTADLDLGKMLPNSENIVGKVCGYKGVDLDENCFYVLNYNEYYKIPIIGTEDIAKLAREELEKSSIE